MHRVTLLGVLLASAAAPAMALDFGGGFYANGEFELEYLDGSGFSGETLGYGKVDVGYQQDGGGFGAFVGFDALNLDNETLSAFYGAISYSGDWGKLQIGVPRNALDDYIATPQVGGARIFDLELSVLDGSLLPINYMVGGIDTPVGLRYDGEFGAAKVGVSYHSIDNIDLVDLGMSYQLAQVNLRGGLEHVNGNGLSETSYFLGAEGEIGPVTAGILLSDISTIGDADAWKVYGTYSPIDALDLTATYQSLDTGGPSQDFYGLAARYTFGPGVYVEGGYLDGDTFGNELFNASLGVKF
jgi:hypothetical protein